MANSKGIKSCAMLTFCSIAVFQSNATQLQTFLSGLSKPVFLTGAGEGTRRLFVVEETGRIKVVPPGSTTPTVFLNLSSRILQSSEQGLLGLAFHPNYAQNRRFFVDYTRAGDGATVVAEYRASETNANVAATNEIVLLLISQPSSVHNGGMLAFGPDGYLYIGTGDGGPQYDPNNMGQDTTQLLGKILRIDVDNPAGPIPYSSPPDNPFFAQPPNRSEIFAYGFRNPWRWSFDRGGNRELFCGDVGQDTYEEIDIVSLGGNYGWRILEGDYCNPHYYSPGGCTPPTNNVYPIFEYGHTNDRCAVVGGYVYRGARSAVSAGAYVFGDYCSGEVIQLNPPTSGGNQSVLFNAGQSISSFGEDEAGELYLLGVGSGRASLLTRSPGPAPCTYTIFPINQTFGYSSSNGSFTVTTGLSDCAWVAASHNEWITILSGSNGVGSGIVTFVVANNPGLSARTGTITAAGHTCTVLQTGSPPLLSVARIGANVLVSWSTNSPGYVLQSAGSLSAANWSLESDSPASLGTNYVVTNVISGTGKFYRLQHP